MLRRIAALFLCLVLFGSGWSAALRIEPLVHEQRGCCPPGMCQCDKCDCTMDTKSLGEDTDDAACVLPAASSAQRGDALAIPKREMLSPPFMDGSVVLRQVFGRGPPGRAPPVVA